jgi:hypothetical protein
LFITGLANGGGAQAVAIEVCHHGGTRCHVSALERRAPTGPTAKNNACHQKNLFHHLTAIRAWAPFGYTFSFLISILLLILKKFVSQLSRQNTDFRPENSNGGRRLEVRFQGASDTSGVSAGVFACMAAEMRLHQRG